MAVSSNEIGYNGQDATVLVTLPRPNNADGGRIAVPAFKPIPTLSEFQIGRFWERVAVSMYDTDACFPWTGRIDAKGYGRVKFFRVGGVYLAHRVAYTLTRGPIPDGLTLDHKCRNRRCCNPEHLEAVTGKENTLRGESVTAKLARKTHCPKGHALSGELGNRRCRTCDRARPQRSQVGRKRTDVERNRERVKERAQRLRAAGLCIQCRLPANGSRCERCRMERNERRRKQ